MKDDFKKVAAAEIAAFKAEYRKRNPGADVEKIDRQRAAARGDEHRRQAGPARRAGPLRRQRLDAHRGLGREHGHPHPRRARVRQPAPLRAGRRPRPAPPLVRRRTTQGMFEPEYANVYGIPFQFISSDKPIKDPLPPKPVIEVCARRGPRGAADRVPEARRLPRRAPRRRDLARPRRRARVRDRSEHGAELGRDGRRRRRARARGGRPDAVPAAGRSPSRSPSASSTPTSTPSTTSDPGSSRGWSRCAGSGSSRRSVVERRLQPRVPDDDHRGAGARRRGGVERDRAAGRQPPRATAPDDQPLRPRRLDRRRRLPDPQAHRADREVRGLPRHPRRQGRQHLGAAPRERARAEQEREVVREERPPRLHDPLRAQGPEPQLHARTSSSGSSPATTRIDADPRSSRSPGARRAQGRPARRRPPRATRGASRSTTTAASAAGATSR